GMPESVRICSSFPLPSLKLPSVDALLTETVPPPTSADEAIVICGTLTLPSEFWKVIVYGASGAGPPVTDTLGALVPPPMTERARRAASTVAAASFQLRVV